MASPIFVVDSSPAVRRLVEQISTPEGFEVQGFQDGPAALEAARRSAPSLIIADYQLDNMTFSGFCKEIGKLDTLTETALISLVNPADHPDENHLRTLGVKAFLKKPFHTEELLSVLRSLQQRQTSTGTSTGLKRRVWPPTSTGADSEDDETDQASVHIGLEAPMNQPVSTPALTLTPSIAPTAPDDVVRSLVDQLVQAMTTRSERSLIALLPQLISEQWGAQVRPLVQKELQVQLGSILSQEYLTTIIQPLVAEALPALIRKEFATSEPILRQAVADLFKPPLAEPLMQVVQEQIQSIMHQDLPAVVREQVGTINRQVTDAVHQEVVKQTPLVVETMVKTSVGLAVEQAVQRIVPDVAEQQIKAEIKRLIETEETSRSTKV
ncbi:MAG: response regulator transcription factor [Nitrospira sp.]|nr:response regulator transcription factor [Nitrospira sp.]